MVLTDFAPLSFKCLRFLLGGPNLWIIPGATPPLILHVLFQKDNSTLSNSRPHQGPRLQWLLLHNHTVAPGVRGHFLKPSYSIPTEAWHIWKLYTARWRIQNYGLYFSLPPQLVPLVSSCGEREGSDLQLLNMHGQDVRRRQCRPLPARVFFPRQAQVVTLQKNLKQGGNK